MTQPGTDEVRVAVRSALEAVGYEVMPFARTRDAVLESVPRSVGLTVTASPQKGLDATVDLAIRLTGDGYAVTPHLSARLLRDRTELDEVLAGLADAEVRSLFVVGGDGEPRGEFPDALTLLQAIHESGHRFADIGVGGYPEGHALIDDDALLTALKRKAEYAHHLVTQICFTPATTRSWADELAEHGIGMPVTVGIPGPISRQKLLRISATIGVGDSSRFLRKQSGMFWRFFTPGGYDPTRLVRGLGPGLADRTSPIAGLHVFTFNDVAGAERWRQDLLHDLRSARRW